jgi:ATP/maltotriose-dependent transcriptional regulator MalT
MRGRLLLEAGDTAGAISVLEPAVAICREHKFVGQTMRALTPLGEAYTAAGRAAEAVPLLHEAIALQEAAGAFVNRALWVRTLAEALRCAGHLDDAAASAQSALDFAVRLGERGNEAWTHFVIAEIAADRGKAAEARDHLVFAREASGRLEMSRLAERCDRALAALATPQAPESNRP